MLCFRIFLVGKKFIDEMEGEVSRFSFENFLSHSAEKIRRGTLKCVLNFGYRKVLCFRGLCHDFRSRTFCLTALKHFVEEPFCAVFQKVCSSEKV